LTDQSGAEGKGRHAIEIVMNSPRFPNAFDNRFHLFAGPGMPGQRLTAAAELALLGILYYVGTTIRYCVSRGTTDREIADAAFSICLGGRTSRLYSALFGEGEGKAYLNSSLSVFRHSAPEVVVAFRRFTPSTPNMKLPMGWW